MTTSDVSTQAVQPTALNTLLVIGAGEGHDIPPDWQEHYQRLVLVEPLPELARSLRLAFGEDPNVKVLETAIIPGVNAGDTVTLYEFNWAQASSRHQPADLLQLFPGLKTERMRRVSALSPQQLIRELDLSAEGEHALVLEAPADEGPIISALIESDAHKSFSRIQLRYPAPGLYDNPTDPEAMLQALRASGFEIETQDQTDPDWPSVSFTRNRWKLALDEARKALEQQRTEQQSRIQALEQRVAETGKRVEQETTAHKEQAAVRSSLEKRLQEQQQALEKLTVERDQQAKRADEQTRHAKELAEARTQAEKLAEDRAAAIQKLAEARTSLDNQLQAATATLETRTKERDEQAKRADQLVARINEEANARKTLEEQLSNVKADEGFHTRRHTMLQIDLDNLRERFTESERQRAQQEALLRKLTPRLAQAAQELKKLRIMPAPVPTALGETEYAQIPPLPETDEPSKKKRKRKRKA